MLFWGCWPPNVFQIARKDNFLLYIIQPSLVDIVIYIFRTFNKFPGPKHPFRGQRRESNMTFWRHLPPNVCQIARKAIFCYILDNFALSTWQFIFLRQLINSLV